LTEITQLNIELRRPLITLSSGIAFNPAGTLLIGGFYDKSIRFWDARPFVARNDEPKIDIVEYTSTDLSGLTDDPSTWPDWWQKCKIKVPQGTIPNPDFCKCLRVIEQKLSYKGLQITGAQGLDIRSLQHEGATLGEWLVSRGAILSAGKKKQASKKKRSATTRKKR